MRIVVSGYMVRHPLAGNVAAFLQYVIGLSRLGHEVTYIEEKGWEWSCWDPNTGQLEQYPHTGLPLVRHLMRTHCSDVPLVYIDADAGTADGMRWADLRDRIAACDLWLDVGGMCWLEERTLARRRVLVDLDPVFTQAGRFSYRLLGEFDAHFSYGTNIGRDGCAVPTGGVDWLPTVPPVVPDLWDAPPPSPDDPFTTITTWKPYGEIEVDGVRYGEKDVELRRIRDLPSRVTPALELAISDVGDEVRADLRAAGWRVRDGGEVTRTIDGYGAYIAGSQGELSVAKHAYVATRSGWVSDRSACYLAAGRPVIVQDTGFTSWLPGDHGVVAFSTPEEAAEAVERVTRDLPAESEAAREVAREHFDYRVVLPKLLARALEPRAVPA